MMKRYALLTLLIGLLVFVVSQLTGVITIRKIEFEVNNLLLNVSASLVAVSVFGVVYYLYGEEPTIRLIKELIMIQSTAKNMRDLGVLSIKPIRDEYDVAEMHSNFSNGSHLFILSRNFNAFEYERVRDLFKALLINDTKKIKVLVQADTTRKHEFIIFTKSLPEDVAKRIEFREADKISSSMYGNENNIYVTINLSRASGNESPCLLCSKTDNNSLHATFQKDFDHQWKNAKPMK